LSESAEPGVNNYLAAVEALVRASQRRNVPEGCAADVAEAMAGAVMASITADWGMRHRDLWDQWYATERSGETPPQEVLLGTMEMMKDLQVAALERDSWRDVANAFESAFKERPK
jgi:hypothetical protein